jgi:HSP20 family molecular chaperone IbpA
MFFTPVIRRSSFVPPLRGVDRQFERWLAEGLQTPAPKAGAVKASVSQDDKAVTLSFDLPGVNKAQLSIAIEGHVVRIESLAEAPRVYKLAYELPQDIDAASSEAKLENGVLTLKLAKLGPVSKSQPLNIV